MPHPYIGGNWAQIIRNICTHYAYTKGSLFILKSKSPLYPEMPVQDGNPENPVPPDAGYRVS